VLWQAIAIAGGLSMIGALLTFGLAPYGHDLVSGAIGFASRAQPLHLSSALALSGALLLTAHLLLNLGLTVVRAERQRRRHAQLLRLLSSPIGSEGDRLIDSPAPVAYCLPGALSSVTVVSAGLLELLDESETRAVIEHERAHVTQRHDVVLVLFRAWYASLPWFPIAYRAQREVGMLVEMLADDRARRISSDPVLARAIALVGAGRTAVEPGPWTAAPSVDELSARIHRLQLPPLPRPLEALVVAAAVALLAVPTVLLFAPAVL
jgi:Zn-dependent protease with chaperone function